MVLVEELGGVERATKQLGHLGTLCVPTQCARICFLLVLFVSVVTSAVSPRLSAQPTSKTTRTKNIYRVTWSESGQKMQSNK